MRTTRLSGFEYQGYFHYFSTMCTFRRQRHFVSASIVERARSIFFTEADSSGIVIAAYCFMPDHLHLVASGRTNEADLVRFGKRSRQRVAFALRTEIAPPVWQDGYYDHILRDNEGLTNTIRYVAENPVRAGLVASWEQFPFTGSQLGDLFDLLVWLDEHRDNDREALLEYDP